MDNDDNIIKAKSEPGFSPTGLRIERYKKEVTCTDDGYMGHVNSYTTTETRFRILNADGSIYDDAHGYGYRSFEAARKAMWYRQNRNKIEKAELTAKRFFKKQRNELLSDTCTYPLLDIHSFKETGHWSSENERCYWEEVEKIVPDAAHLGKDVKNAIVKLVMKNL